MIIFDFAHLSVAELRRNGLPEYVILYIEMNRAQLQHDQNMQQLRHARSGQKSIIHPGPIRKLLSRPTPYSRKKPTKGANDAPSTSAGPIQNAPLAPNSQSVSHVPLAVPPSILSLLSAHNLVMTPHSFARRPLNHWQVRDGIVSAPPSYFNTADLDQINVMKNMRMNLDFALSVERNAEKSLSRLNFILPRTIDTLVSANNERSQPAQSPELSARKTLTPRPDQTDDINMTEVESTQQARPYPPYFFSEFHKSSQAGDNIEIEHTPPFESSTHVIPQLSDTFQNLHLESLANVTVYKSNSELPDLTGLVTRSKAFASACGGFADVWEANWGGRKVAVKVLRSILEDEEAKDKLKKRLRRELRVWRRLTHTNVLPLLGVASDFGPYTSMVCPWMASGTLSAFLQRSKSTLTLSNKFTLLNQVADGLSYLHSHEVIHGDLTGSNILINDLGAAFLSDFGLSTIVAEFQGTSYFTSNIRGSVRYAAPEIYAVSCTASPPAVRVSVYSDVYSFGSITLQTLSCRIPYHYLKNDAMVLLEVHNGKPHQRPPETWFTTHYWEFINKCWNGIPHSRPTMEEVISFVKNCNSAVSAQNDRSLPPGSMPVIQSKEHLQTHTMGSPFDCPTCYKTVLRISTRILGVVVDQCVPVLDQYEGYFDLSACMDDAGEVLLRRVFRAR